ncbi:hypothetical protein SAMN06298216_1117 [Spirosomataceae bacterium TFI 002]|nr:hypothetical protein SAMN06298216_1117 [Spirosomataceae bacterium TFI 002]
MKEIRHGQLQLISFLWLRRGIGLAGIVLPIFLIAGTYLVGNEECKTIQSAISDYYHTIVRDIFVGVLAVLAIFLFSYKGPEKIDNIAANLAGLFALGIAYFPTSIKTCNQWNGYENPVMHNISAVSFFLVLTYFSLFLFPKTSSLDPPTPEKLKRNKIYKTCGIIMLISIIIVGIQMTFLEKVSPFDSFPIILIFEWVALWAFGISWIVKGELFLEDK